MSVFRKPVQKYKRRHVWVGKVIHRDWCKKSKWVLESKTHKSHKIWVKTDHPILVRKSDLVFINKKKIPRRSIECEKKVVIDKCNNDTSCIRNTWDGFQEHGKDIRRTGVIFFFLDDRKLSLQKLSRLVHICSTFNYEYVITNINFMETTSKLYIPLKIHCGVLYQFFFLSLVCWISWHIKLYWLFIAKCIFM